MARGFRRRGRGVTARYAARLDPYERALLVNLLEQVHGLLAPTSPSEEATEAGTGDAFDSIVAGLGDLGEGLGPGPVPADSRSAGNRDPALQRLLPAASRQDPEAAEEFRRLAEAGLRDRKAANLRTAAAALSRAADDDVVELDERSGLAVVVALTDVRLVLGERLGLRSDEDVERLEEEAAALDPEDPFAHAVAVYDFLTWLQETLASAMRPVAGGGHVARGPG